MNKLNVLIVEDDIINAKALKLVINKFGFNVTDIVSNEIDINNSINKNKPNVIIMDISLNTDKNGIEIIKNIYSKEYIPVIYLSGSMDDETIDKALETNPIAYLTKPYRKIELKTSLKLALKTNLVDKSKKIINMGDDYTFDMKNLHLYYKNEIQKLSIHERQFLNLLLKANGKLVTFETIEFEVWQNENISKDGIRLLVSRLRKKLKQPFIKTIRSYGFKFNIKP